ncbi:TetR/AcrR family transcriptional regulator [Streptomyces sp. NBC_00557]|jgi:AcrR family transcriptional regulator|uniref:TetR/AcrR family transcriptional regulator n=1 Tax=Streptomyces sp. NBC_00557 TaxID=2975776 RepID=UPI002E80EF45|nr:TetR/AcrR family transcriptional regulator [Streptomyces sp. NBC_00557]WUC40207.1 TetR/AcrR family transcriptional regulator [Streptomyces sp. NBC_00557]
MGHRDALLEGAKQCLTEKGYARTTARDIVAASGANLASIGYHYGSKEALLNEALIRANAEWGEALEKSMAYDDESPASPREQFEAVWTKVIELFSGHRRLWSVNFEALTQIEHSPEIREALADGLQEARVGMGEALLAQLEEESDERTVRAVGSFFQALLTGVMAQWLIDPESAPTGPDLSYALLAIMTGTRDRELSD